MEGLQQSLDALAQLDISTLPPNELSSTLSDIISVATSVRDGTDLNTASKDEEQSSAEGAPSSPSSLPPNRPLHNNIAPRRKLSQPFIAPIAFVQHQEGDMDTMEPPANSPLLAGSPSQQPRERLRTLMSNAPKLGAKISRAVSNAAGTIHPSMASSGGVGVGVADDGGEADTASSTSVAQPAHPAMSRPRRPLLSGRRRDANPEASWINAARDAFRIIDVNGDGYLQKEEVIRAISTMQDENSEVDFAEGGDPAEMANKMMAEVDTDGDGQIGMDEFVEMMRKGQQQAGGGGGAGGKGGRAAGVGGLSMSYNHRMSQLARNVLLAHQKKIENSVIGDDLWMIHPMSNVHAIWDVLVSLLILLTVITMPLSIGWDDLNDAFFAMNLTVDFIFLLDVCKNFCTGFINENDAVIMEAKVVRRNYLTGFFITDLCSSLPLDLILRAAGASDAGGAVTGTKQSLKMLKLLRMAKLFRLLRISRLFKHIKELLLYLEERLNFRISDGFTKLLRLGIGALVLGHWIGCFNFMLVRLHNFPEDSWVVYAGLDDKDAYTQWSWSFFKALAQMIMIGFETPPFTNASCDTASQWCGIEHWITLMCLYIGAVFYSLLISSISAVLQTASLASRQFEEKLTVIDDYMRSKKLPAAMREKVKDYFHLQHANGKLYNETEILDMVTPILRREIKQFNGRDITNKVPIFKSVANKDFAEEMTNAIEPTIAFNNEVIMRENTTGDEMYFINSGVVEIFVAGAKNSAYVVIGDGCVSVGRLAWEVWLENCPIFCTCILSQSILSPRAHNYSTLEKYRSSWASVGRPRPGPRRSACCTRSAGSGCWKSSKTSPRWPSGCARRPRAESGGWSTTSTPPTRRCPRRTRSIRRTARRTCLAPTLTSWPGTRPRPLTSSGGSAIAAPPASTAALPGAASARRACTAR